MSLKKKYPKAVKIKQYSAKEIQKNFPYLWDTIRNLLPGLHKTHVAIMASVALSMCKACYESPEDEETICPRCCME